MPISKRTLPESIGERVLRCGVAALSAQWVIAFTLLSDAAVASSPYVEPPHRHVVDGQRDDLLTGGLGLLGLAQPPSLADPQQLANWTEQRRRAIHQNWRALVDLRRWPYGNDIKVAGIEYVADVKADRQLPGSAFLLQIPSTFNPSKPCLLVTAASGSRGIFGSLPTVGQWGLRRGCAVVTDDKGLGMRITDTTNGWRLTATGRIDPATVSKAPFPHALQMAHAHSTVNSERNWGRLLLRSGKLALNILSAEFPQSAPFSPTNTLIIAAGISNGGGAVLQALEQDDGQFFDGAVASEPNVHVRGASSLYDYATWHALIQPCAVLAENLAEIPLGVVISLNRDRYSAWCQRLVDDRFVSGVDTASQAIDARRQLIESGIEPSALRLGAVNLQFGLWTSVAATYAQSYLRREVDQAVCDVGFAAIDASGRPRALSPAERASLFSDGTGIAPTAGIGLLVRDREGIPSSTTALLYETARCLRDALPQVARATERLNVRGAPGNRPVIVIHGRSDGLIPISHTSRRYAALASKKAPFFRFLEVAKGQHFDAFLAIPGMEPEFAPMQPVLDRSLDDVYGFLTENTALPASGILN